MEKWQLIDTDLLIIGAGGAGLRAAIEARENGISLVLVSKEILGKAHTCMAEGGFNVALTENNPNCTPEVHFQDTMNGGAWLNNPKLVKIFTKEAPARIKELENYGMIFDRDKGGKIAQRYSGKQTYPLTVFVGDYTGRAMMTALVDRSRELKIPYLEEHFVSKIFRNKNQFGALVIDIKTGEFKYFRTKAILLATGGGGGMYRVTTNAASNTADGYALALELGCGLIDMEMVQFHPTGMVYPDSLKGALVTESVRGEGGILLNNKGERFMKRYLPDKLELGGRDEVARAIYSEIQEGRGSKHGGVYLDVSHLSSKVIEERLPKMLEQFLLAGVDIRKEPMEVHPTMHHVMGGIMINEWGESSVEGLFSAGEVCGGIHGGNRLGGNAISADQVFGKRAVIGIANYLERQRKTKFLKIEKEKIEREISLVLSLLKKENGVSPYKIEHKLKNLMWENVGIVKEEKGLKKAKKELKEILKETKILKPYYRERLCNNEWIKCFELENMIKTAEIVIETALRRKESRGAHFRSDYPKVDKRYDCNFIVKEKKGKITIKKQPLARL